MPPAKQQSKGFVLLDESAGGQAMVKLDGGDTFFLTVSEAARSCQLYDSSQYKDFLPQFRRFWSTLESWIESHKDRIKSAHLTLRERGMLFLVVQKSAEHDRQLTDDLTDLDLAIANDEELNLIELDVLSVPPAPSGADSAFMATGASVQF